MIATKDNGKFEKKTVFLEVCESIIKTGLEKLIFPGGVAGEFEKLSPVKNMIFPPLSYRRGMGAIHFQGVAPNLWK